MRTARALVSAASAAAVVVTLVPALAQPVASAVLREGDIVTLTGLPATLLGLPATNDVGGYAVAINAGTGISAFWGSASGGTGTVLRAESTVATFTQTAFEGFYGIANAGQIGYSPTTNGGPAPATGADTVWVDDLPIAFQGFPVAAIPGQFWSFASRPTVATQTGEGWWVSGITSTAGGSTQNRGLFRGTGIPVLIGGDSVAGATELISTAATSQFDFQISGSANNWIGTFTFAGAASTIDTAPILNGAVYTAGGSVVREGSPVPASIGGLTGENYQNFGVYGINNAGQVLVVGDSSAATTVDAFIMLDGQIIVREGDLVSGLATTGSFTGADLNESGDWAVLWSVTSGVTREALIYNGEVLLKETDLVDVDGDGTAETALVDISSSEVAIGERINGAVDIYFTGDTSTTSGVGEALFRIRVPIESNCGTADFDGDGDSGTDADIEAFFSCLAGTCCDTCFGADFDNDGDTGTDADIEAFFRVLAGQPC